ncbi:MAG: T9SS C-terminal target domain-containing protein, partial [Bacteroidetes bacterium]
QIANEGLGLLYASNGITTLVEGDALALGLELYPNPSQGELNIAFRNPVAQPVQIALYSLEGRLMHTISGAETLQAGPVNLSWDAGNLPSGVYLLRMVTSEAVYSLRWMLLR